MQPAPSELPDTPAPIPAPGTTPSPKPRRRWVKPLIITGVIAVTLPFIFVTIIAINLSGGISSILRELKPTPDFTSAAIAEKRAGAERSASQSFDTIEKALISLQAYGMSTHDRCYEGQNNWKVQDGFAHRCVYRVTKFYGFNGDFRAQMVAFEEEILKQGWDAPFHDKPLLGILTEYYDQFYGPEKEKPKYFADGYLVSDLPKPASYQKADGFLDITYAEKATTNISSLEYEQTVQRGAGGEPYEKKNFENLPVIFQKITADNQYLLAVSIEEHYFED